MNDMYSLIEKLCNERGINVTQMCKEADIPRGNLTDLKKGRTAALATKNLSKISAYFGVPMDYFLGIEQKENALAETSKGLSDDDIKAAFFGGADPNLTKEEIDAMWEDAQEYFRFKIAQRRQNKQDGK